MLSSVLKRSQSINHEAPQSSSPVPNPQKPTQKTSESSEQQKEQLSLEEYTKLQILLQARQASLREHAKHEYQLKLFIEDLEEKNKNLEKNNNKILSQYKAEVANFKKENEGLRKMVQKLETQNSQLRRQLQQVTSNHTFQKRKSDNTTPEHIHSRAKSQSVIKVIESVDHKHSFLESQPNFRLSPYNMSGKEQPIIAGQESKRNIIQSQSRQKLQVTIKSSRFIENERNSTYGRNQKHILGQGNKNDENGNRERSIKRLMDLKKRTQGHEDEVVNKKLTSESNSSIIKKWPQSHSSAQDYSCQSNDKSSLMGDEIAQERIVVRNSSRQLGSGMKKSIHSSGNSKQLASGSGEEQRSRQIKRSKPKDHELIKLGHYGSTNLNGEKGSGKISGYQML